MNTIDFINIIGQQSLLKNSVNPTEIKIDNDTAKNMIEKYKKTEQNLHWRVCFFQAQSKTTLKFFLLQPLVC